MLVVAGRDASERLELVEEPLDEVALLVEEGAEREGSGAVGFRFHVGPGAAGGETGAQGVGVVGAISEQDLAGADVGHELHCRRGVVGLPLGQLQRDWQAVGVDQGVDLGGQATPRTAHATGSVMLFWALEAC